MTAAPPVVAVVGPTATGKSALAVALARRLGGEVVNADSMQLYRGMDIGTAKPDAAERGGVPHHLLDLWTCREPARVAEYQRRGPRRRSTGCARPGTVPLLVGGSGLYVRAVLDELEFPGTDPAVRARLEAELADGRAGARCTPGWPALDPAAAAAILPSNGRRIVRALEVIELTGRPVHRAAARAAAALPGGRQLGLDRRPGRARRADRPPGGPRCGRPASSTRSRRWPPTGCARGRTASRALGYAQVLAAARRRAAPRRRRASGTVQHHPPVRPPAAVVVPPRPGGSPGSTPRGPTWSTPSRSVIAARTIGA